MTNSTSTAGFTLPVTPAGIFRHFNLVEPKRTSLLRVFCIDSHVAEYVTLKTAYKKLAILVHPDRCTEDRNAAERCMKIVSRAWKLVNIEANYAKRHGWCDSIEEFELSAAVVFTNGETKKEKFLNENDEEDDFNINNPKSSHRNRSAPHSPGQFNPSRSQPQSGRASSSSTVPHQPGRNETSREREEEQERLMALRAANIAVQRERERQEKERKQQQEERTKHALSAEEDAAVDKERQQHIPDIDEHVTSPVNELTEDEDSSIEELYPLDDINAADYIFHEQHNEGDSRASDGIEDDTTARGSPSAAGTNAGRGSGISEKKMRRSMQKRASKNRTMERAKAAIRAEAEGSLTWRPRRCVEVSLQVGIQVNFRWKCEQLIRAYTAYIAVNDGIYISQSLEKVVMKCRRSECGARIVFDWQPRSGLWKLNKFLEHCNECYGHGLPSNSAGRTNACAAAYTPRQVARAVLEEASSEPNISAAKIAQLVKAKDIYRRQPPMSHFRSVRVEILKHMAASRSVDMAAMDGYADVLRSCGHTVHIYNMDGKSMKETRVKAARHIFNQCQKGKTIPKDAVFNEDVVDVSDIIDDGRYYEGLLFVPSVACQYIREGRNTCAADAAHCDGVGPQSYGTTFEVVTYDTNMHLLPLLFAHFVGAECHEYWHRVFSECQKLEGFDVESRTTIVDQEKSIDSAYKDVFQNAKMFLDPMHVRKNMGSALGASRAVGISLYDKALYAPTEAAVDEVVARYSETQAKYLGRFKRSELYRAYSSLDDTIVTSQGAESQMSSSIRNCVRTVEPQKMLQKVVLLHRAGFLNRQQKAHNCEKPVPPAVEKHIASLIQRSRVYQSTVSFIGEQHMEASVASYTDGSIRRHVRLPLSHGEVPKCCGYSELPDGYPCLHGVSVLCEKFGSSNIHNFVEPRNLTSQWKKIYNDVTFPYPSQADVDDVISKAKLLVLSGENMNIPKALPPPRGRPVKNAGVRRKGWFERGPSAGRKRSYSCSLCHNQSHTASGCPLRQLFE